MFGRANRTADERVFVDLSHNIADMSVVTTGPTIDRHRGDLARLFQEKLPQAIEAECALLGSMILDWNVVGEVVQILDGGDDFYQSKHGALYRVLVEMYDQNQSLDMVQLKHRLEDLGLLEQVGGVAYLIELAESVPSASSAAYYARIVKEKSVLRRLIDAAGQILHNAYSSAEPVGAQLDQAEQKIFGLAQSSMNDEAVELKVLLQETYARLEAHDGRHLTGLATGYYELDDMTNGLQNGEMIIIAARPSMGKTALALNMAEHLAADHRQAVAVFSLEMSKQQLAQRLLCSRGGVDSQKVRKYNLSPDEFGQLAMVVGELSEAPLYIDDTPSLSLLALRAKARRLAARHDIKAVFVDYLQLMTGPRSESRQQEVSSLSRGIKAMARELNVPVVCLSQLNRSSEGREGHRPRMSDLRESGSIEQDADVVMLLHREDYYHRGEEDHVDDNTAELIIAKQRNGPTGSVKMQFTGVTMRFNNLAQTHHRPSF